MWRWLNLILNKKSRLSIVLTGEEQKRKKSGRGFYRLFLLFMVIAAITESSPINPSIPIGVSVGTRAEGFPNAAI